jgi:hypothetical protein
VSAARSKLLAVGGNGQTALRNRLCEDALAALTRGDVGIVEAVVACMGATATVLALLSPDSRERLVLELEGKLLEHANKRADDIRSGRFDAEIGVHQ